ncbi:hypothetical protein IAU60_000328 [Kwoniella sp. DSM 27419]
MSASTSRITAQQLKPIIRTLPASPLSEGVQLADALDAIVDRAFAGAATTTPASGSTTVTPPAQGVTSSMDGLKVAANQRRLTQMRDSIARIRASAPLREFPLSQTTLSPPNDPFFYTRVRNGFSNAAKGIQRPWWKNFFNIKGAE